MIELAESSRPVDLITLIEELKRHKELEAVGDVGYVSGLMDGVPDRPSIRHYIKIVREKAAQRKLIHACQATIGTIGDGCSSQEAIEGLGERILQIQTGSDEAPAQRVVSFTDQVYNDWEKLADGNGDLIGLSTSLDCLDLATTGIRKGELWLIGGRTGDGKTCLGLADRRGELSEGEGNSGRDVLDRDGQRAISCSDCGRTKGKSRFSTFVSRAA